MTGCSTYGRCGAVAVPAPLAPRAAEALHWLGRYAERAEGTARLLRVTDDLVEDQGGWADAGDGAPRTPGAAAAYALSDAVGDVTGVPRGDATPADHVRAMVGDVRRPGTVAYAVGRLVRSSQDVRDVLSSDIWHVLSRLERTVVVAGHPDDALQPKLYDVLESSLALSGVVAENMVRDESWGHLDGGMRIERAQLITALVRSGLAHDRPPVTDAQVTEAVLEACDSIITHRRRLASGDGPSWPVHSAIGLLLVDPTNPRSVAFQLDRLAEDFVLVGDDELARRTRELREVLRGVDVDEVGAGDRTALAELCDELERDAAGAGRRPRRPALPPQASPAHRRRRLGRTRGGRVMQRDDDFLPRRYRVRHRTTYTYDDTVDACYERGFLAPRDTDHQQVESSTLRVSPEPDVVAEHRDHVGNRSFYVEVRTPHTLLEVEKDSVVDVDRPRPDLAALDAWTVADAAAHVRSTADPVTRAEGLLPSPLVELSAEVRAYAAEVLPPDRRLGEALTALHRTIKRDFAYRPGATTVRTTLTELLALRQGVCQDFAHLAVGCLRSVGLPARYVSGYLETVPPPGRERLVGQDASHAWVSVLVPGADVPGSTSTRRTTSWSTPATW